jgi:tight adherence protein B
MEGLVVSARLRPLFAGLLATGFLAASALTASAAPAPSPVNASLTGVQVTSSGVTAILTTVTAGGAKIDPASVKATIAGVAAPVSVQPIGQEHRAAILLIDTSGSMGTAGMQTVGQAADAFLTAVPKDVYVGVVAFSTVPTVAITPTLDRARVRAAVAALQSRGETSLYDGVATALAQLGGSGDRSFVLVSDGGDTRSRSTLTQTLAALSASGVRAQVVGYKTSESQGPVLASLAQAGHGSVSATSSSAAVSDAFVKAAFTAAAKAVGSQVRVHITPPPSTGGIRSLAVTGNAGGQAFSSSTVVNLAAKSQLSPSASSTHPTVGASGLPPAPSAPSKGPLGMAWLLAVALAAIFLGLCGLVFALVAPKYVSGHQRRVESIEGYVTDQAPREGDRSAVAALSASLVSMGDKVMDSRSSTPRTLQLLERADLPLRLGEWAVLRAVAVVVGVAGGVFLMQGGSVSMFIGACLGGLAGVFVPVLYLKFAASRRAGKFENQLPDILTLVASSLSTGFSLLQALDAVARDADEPSAKEFSRALAETRIGADLNDSLAHLADRMDSKNLRWTAMAIDIQRQVGGNLGETLRNTAATLRDRQALARHVKALAAEGKLSAYILIALPIFLFLYMLFANRPYVELLWTNLIGIGMSVAGLISLAFGVVWMNKVVKVEV